MRGEVGPGYAFRVGASGGLRNSRWADKCFRRAAWTENLLNAAVHVRLCLGGSRSAWRSEVSCVLCSDNRYRLFFHLSRRLVFRFIRLYCPPLSVPSMNLIRGVSWGHGISLQRACLTSLTRRLAWERSCRLLIEGQRSLQLPLLRNGRPVPAQCKVGPAVFTHYGFRVVICRFLPAGQILIRNLAKDLRFGSCRSYSIRLVRSPSSSWFTAGIFVDGQTSARFPRCSHPLLRGIKRTNSGLNPKLPAKSSRRPPKLLLNSHEARILML